MRTIIAGSRTIADTALVYSAIESAPFPITHVLSGGARGVDAAGEAWAKLHDVPLTLFPADWATHGKAAGPLRNRTMADLAEALILIWTGQPTTSPGSANMLQEARKRHLLVHEVLASQTPPTPPGRR